MPKSTPSRSVSWLTVCLTGGFVWAAMTGAVATPPPTLPALQVESNARWFATVDGRRFDYREISAFSLLSRLLTGEEAYVRGHLRTVKGLGFTVVRVILTLDGAYWTETPLGRSFRSGPDMPGYWEALSPASRPTRGSTSVPSSSVPWNPSEASGTPTGVTCGQGPSESEASVSRSRPPGVWRRTRT